MSTRTLLLTFALALLSCTAAAHAQDYPVPPPPPPPPPAPVDLTTSGGYQAPPPPGAVVPAATVAAPVSVRFVAKTAGNEYLVTLQEGVEPVKVPCELKLMPGARLKLGVTGASTFSARITVPAEAASTATIEHKNKGLMGLGIAGAVVAVVGVLMLELPLEMLLAEGLGDAIVGPMSGSSFDAGRVMQTRLDPLPITLETWTIIGGVVAAVGVVCTAVGFATMGKSRIVLVPDGHAGEAAPKLELVGVGLAPVSGGGASAGATFAF